MEGQANVNLFYIVVTKPHLSLSLSLSLFLCLPQVGKQTLASSKDEHLIEDMPPTFETVSKASKELLEASKGLAQDNYSKPHKAMLMDGARGVCAGNPVVGTSRNGCGVDEPCIQVFKFALHLKIKAFLPIHSFVLFSFSFLFFNFFITPFLFLLFFFFSFHFFPPFFSSLFFFSFLLFVFFFFFF